MKKLVKKIEKNTAYDSDEEKNPYASSVSHPILIPFVQCLTDRIGGRGGGRADSSTNRACGTGSTQRKEASKWWPELKGPVPGRLAVRISCSCTEWLWADDGQGQDRRVTASDLTHSGYGRSLSTREACNIAAAAEGTEIEGKPERQQGYEPSRWRHWKSSRQPESAGPFPWCKPCFEPVCACSVQEAEGRRRCNFCCQCSSATYCQRQWHWSSTEA